MPMVNGEKFPYTAKGKKAAMAKASKKPTKKARNKMKNMMMKKTKNK
jgi:hypothetical protein